MAEPISDEELESLRVLIAAGPLVGCTWEQGSVLRLAESFIARLDAANQEIERLRWRLEKIAAAPTSWLPADSPARRIAAATLAAQPIETEERDG